MKKNYKNNPKLVPLRKRLYAALAMLLLSTILMTSSTLAWFVMSTAPEVKNIQTQIGANGALEIALLNSDSWNDLDLLDMGDIDESATESIASRNITWGNLVDLNDPAYGLSKINLMPSRLYIEEAGTDDNGNTQYAINSAILKTPIYGEDGRVVGLDKDSTVSYIHQSNMFGTEGYGVRAIGTSSTMSAFQLGMNSAKSALLTNMAAARTQASNTLNQQGGKLAAIVVAYSLSSQTEGYTDNDIQAIKDMAVGMGASLDYIETAMRYAFVGYITTEDAGVSQADYEDTVAAILDSETTIASLLTTYPGITALVPDMSTYITQLATDRAIVENGISACDTAMAGSDSFTWNQISAIVDPIVETNSMLVGGMSIPDVKEYVMPGGTVDFGRAMELLSNGGITITVPSGSGLLSDISDFAGDYTAKVTVENFSYGSIGPMNIDVNMQTATSASPVYLTACSNGLKGATVSAAEGSNSITDYYGYAIDLAFRTNADESNLLLQTEQAQRVYDDSTSILTQGGGSFMRFTTGAGLSATKMVKLMSGIRVVFMDDQQTVLGIAVLDTKLGKDAYVELSAEEKTETGMYAYLAGSASAYQNSDLISYDQYEALPEESAVTFDSVTGEVSAKLYLYDFTMTLNENNDKTGAITIQGKRNDGVITPLVRDVPKRITTVVYLDGSVVNNSMVAADAIQSMTGVLNLQFASDALLIPAENSKLRGIEAEPVEPTDPGDVTPDPEIGGG